MEINSILSMGSGYGNYSSVNEVRLQKALEKASGSKTKSEYLKNNPISQSPTLSGTESSTKFIGQYTSSMSNMMSSANELRATNSSSVWNKLTPTSSDSNIISASNNYTMRSAANYEVNVKQLAKAQINSSSAVNSNDFASGDINLSLVTNSANADFSVSALKSDGTQKTNKQVLSEMALKVNSDKNLGLTASVIEKDGKSSLQITGKTGESNAFLAGGDFAESTGLAAKTQSATDAKYSVSKNGQGAISFSSSSNNISLDYGKMSATLKSTGSANVSLGVNSDKVIKSVENLVKSYNSSLKLLNDNYERGSGVSSQLSNMLRGPASEKSMELVGISVNKDGTLALDSKKLASSLKNDPSLTKDVIGNSFGVAQGVFQNATSGLSRSGMSLINNDLQALNEQKNNDPISFMGMYSRRGVYNSMNYTTAGMLFNSIG